jgi:urease accessory protein
MHGDGEVGSLSRCEQRDGPMKTLKAFVNLLQFSDGLFPAGGYAHSFGLETCVQSGQVKSAEDVGAFLHAYLAASAAPTDALAVLHARGHAIAGDLDACLHLDQLLDALKPASELREASRQMGRQTLRALKVLSADAFVSRFAAAVESEAAPSHHPIVFGIAAAVLAWPPRETASAFLYSTSTMIVGAALRLLPLGQLAGQRILWSAGAAIPALAEGIESNSGEGMWSFTPEIEIAAMRHESLDARLFRS